MVKRTYAWGSLQGDWTDSGSLLPVSEWASDILGQGLEQSTFVSSIPKPLMRRANKKQLFLKSNVTTDVSSLWATNVQDAHSYEHALDYDTCSIDPVEYRTITPVAYETLDEIDMVGLEADIRKQLEYATAQKLTWMAYSKLDDEDIQSDGEWNVAGSALNYCNDNTVDWDTQLTIDNLLSGVDAIVADLYKPSDCFLPPALYIDLFSESQFRNAAEYGSGEQIKTGVLPKFMGVTFHLDSMMPDDSSSNDVGIMADMRFFEGFVLAKDGRITVHDRWNTGEFDFCLNVKCGATVIQEKAGCAFYS